MLGALFVLWTLSFEVISSLERSGDMPGNMWLQLATFQNVASKLCKQRCGNLRGRAIMTLQDWAGQVKEVLSQGLHAYSQWSDRQFSDPHEDAHRWDAWQKGDSQTTESSLPSIQRGGVSGLSARLPCWKMGSSFCGASGHYVLIPFSYFPEMQSWGTNVGN